METRIQCDEDGYPTEDALKAIAEWPHAFGFRELMRSILPCWRYAESGYWEKSTSGAVDVYELSTAGWSGNESIISALESNRIFWLFCWHQSTRGGHYIFHMPPTPDPA